MSRRVEELLRSGVAAARREPSPDLRARLRTALGEGRVPTAFAERAREEGWRARFRSAIAAGAVLAAAGFWIVAIVGGLRAPPRSVDPTSVAGLSSPDRTPRSLVDLSRWTPRSLSSAVDGSLLDELARIEEDASRAARFLVGRLPAPLVTSADRGVLR